MDDERQYALSEYAEAVSRLSHVRLPLALVVSDLSYGAKAMYAVLASFAGVRGTFPGRGTIAARMNLDVKNCGKFLDELRATGWITAKRRGLGLPNLYYLHAEPGTAVEPVEDPDRAKSPKPQGAESSVLECTDSPIPDWAISPILDVADSPNKLTSTFELVPGELPPTSHDVGGENRASDRKRKRQVPADWHPGGDLVVWTQKLWLGALRNDLSLSEQVDQFRDFHRAKGNTFLDVDAAWRTWARRAMQYNRPPNGSGAPRAVSALSREAWDALPLQPNETRTGGEPGEDVPW